MSKNWFMSAAMINQGFPDGMGCTITDFFALMYDSTSLEIVQLETSLMKTKTTQVIDY